MTQGLHRRAGSRLSLRQGRTAAMRSSALCKVVRSGDMVGGPCRSRIIKSRPSLHVQPPTTFERRGCRPLSRSLHVLASRCAREIKREGAPEPNFSECANGQDLIGQSRHSRSISLLGELRRRRQENPAHRGWRVVCWQSKYDSLA